MRKSATPALLRLSKEETTRKENFRVQQGEYVLELTATEISVKKVKRYSIGEEIANAITHGIGAGLSVAALVLRAVQYAPEGQRGAYVTGFTIFGVTLIILYMMSTLYHALTPEKAKKVFSIMDHSSIYLLIAGTYTAFCLSVLRGPVGWTVFGIIWGLTAAGVSLYAVFGNRLRAASVVTYILMGWLIVFAFKPLREGLPRISIVFLMVGGGAYTLGCIFYAMKKVKWMHSIWHLFVLGGSIMHFFSVYFSVPI